MEVDTYVDQNGTWDKFPEGDLASERRQKQLCDARPVYAPVGTRPVDLRCVLDGTGRTGPRPRGHLPDEEVNCSSRPWPLRATGTGLNAGEEFHGSGGPGQRLGLAARRRENGDGLEDLVHVSVTQYVDPFQGVSAQAETLLNTGDGSWKLVVAGCAIPRPVSLP